MALLTDHFCFCQPFQPLKLNQNEVYFKPDNLAMEQLVTRRRFSSHFQHYGNG